MLIWQGVFSIIGKNGVVYANNMNDEYSVGPLSIYRQTKQALTVFGAELILNEYEFHALDMLAERAGEPLTFEVIYTAAWGAATEAYSRDAARLAMENLLKQVAEIGRGFMWIECLPEAEYIFRARWSHNLRQAPVHKKYLSRPGTAE